MKNDIPAAGREVCNNFFQLQSKPGDIVCFFVTLVSRLRRVRRMRLQVVGIIFGSDPSSKSDRDLRTSGVGLSRLCIHLMMAHTREMSHLQRDVYQSFSPVIMRQHAFLLSIVCGLHRETTEKRNLFRCTWKERAVQLRCENRAAMLELECPPSSVLRGALPLRTLRARAEFSSLLHLPQSVVQYCSGALPQINTHAIRQTLPYTLLTPAYVVD